MIDVNYHIMLYGEKFLAENFVPEEIAETIGQRIKVELSEYNPKVFYLYPLCEQEFEDVFLGKVLDSIKIIWQTQALKQLIAYISTNHADKLSEINKIVPGSKNPNANGVLDILLQTLLETDGISKLKPALTLFDWEDEKGGKNKPGDKKGGHWSKHTTAARKGRFFFLRFGIERRNFHMDIAHDDQCNYETGEETIRLMQNLGLSLSFTCYESDIVAKNQPQES